MTVNPGLETLLADFARLDLTERPLPELERRAVAVSRISTRADHGVYEEVRKRLTGGGAAGWVRLRSAIYPTDGGNFPTFGAAGPPLAGEWAESETKSVRLSAGPEPGTLWRTTYIERALEPGEPPREDEIEALRQVVSVLRHGEVVPGKAPKRMLVYHEFWAATAVDPSAVRRRFDRFVGFDSEQKGFRP